LAKIATIYQVCQHIPLTPPTLPYLIHGMPKLIEDEFTHLPLSRQRKYQLRKQKFNCCRTCGKPIDILFSPQYCPIHYEAHKVFARTSKQKKAKIKREKAQKREMRQLAKDLIG